MWTLAISKTFPNTSKHKRELRIERLRESQKALAEALGPESFETVQANLNFMLAMGILAKELKRSSPNAEEISKAQNLIKESAKFSEPAKIASKMDFNDWKNFSLTPKERKERYHEVLAAIKEAGCEEIVAKRDIKEVFRMTSPETVKKDKAIHILKITAAVLSLPIVWSATLAAALAVLAGLIITWPIWSPNRD